MKHQSSRERGSALVWVLALALVFSILGAAIGWVALSMNDRSVKNFTLKQNYFTSRSAIDAVAQNLNGYERSINYNESFNAYLNANLVNGNKSITIPDFFGTIGTSNNMNNCEVTGTYKQGKISLIAQTGAGDEGTVSATAQRECVTNSTAIDGTTIIDHSKWPNSRWANRLDKTKTVGEFRVGTSASAINTSFKDADVSVYKVTRGMGDAQGISKGDIVITKDENKEKKAIFIYVKPGATLTITGLKTKNAGDLSFVKSWFGDGSLDEEEWSQYYGPDIFIYLDGTDTDKATLTIDNSDMTRKNTFPFYVVGNNKSKITTTVPNRDVTVNFTTNLDAPSNVKTDMTNSEPSNKPISGYYYSGKPATGDETGLIPQQWTVTYTNGE